MGSLTDKFSDLAEVLRAEFQRVSSAPRPNPGGQILIDRLLRPLLPAAMRVGPGSLIDVKDREVGPFDAIACSETWPPIGDGAATSFLLDGVAVIIQARDWAVSDLTQFAAQVGVVRTLERSTPKPIFAAAVSYTDLPLREIIDFLSSPSGKTLDGVLSIGSHVVIRNAQGLYGDVTKVPYVTERGSGESLKAFVFAVTHAAHSFLGQPFGFATYQHL